MSYLGACKRSKPGELDPQSSYSPDSSDPENVVVGSKPGLIPHSYSASFSASDLAYAKLRGPSTWESDSPRSASPKTRMPGHKRSWNDLILAFIAGVAVAYLFIQFGGKAGTELLLRQQTLLLPHADDSLCQETYVPQGTALSPLALGNLTGNPQATTDRLIVAARHTEDTSWLDVYLSDIPHIVYQIDDPALTKGALHRTVKNKGNEAMAYLQFIIDYYDRLPASMVFLHGHRGTWHFRDHVPILRRLKWGSFGFANLRFAPGTRLEWACGNNTDDPNFKPFDCNWVGGVMHMTGMAPRKANLVNVMNKDEWGDSIELISVWPQMYEEELGPPPPILAAPCCAEFMVSRDRILAHPKSFYVHLRDWIAETEVSRYRTGREFEYVWHYMFGEPPSIDPVRECDLLHCTEEELAASEAQLKAIPKYQSPDPTSPQLGVPQSIALAGDQNRLERP
eukprot:jgi/Botrbrau1/765/Bobra.0181s0022.2